MALNIRNDLSVFDLMVPCGLDGIAMTSVLKETGRSHDMHEVKKSLVEFLTAHFGKPDS
jgi:lipoate-protein ligase B